MVRSTFQRFAFYGRITKKTTTFVSSRRFGSDPTRFSKLVQQWRLRQHTPWNVEYNFNFIHTNVTLDVAKDAVQQAARLCIKDKTELADMLFLKSKLYSDKQESEISVSAAISLLLLHPPPHTHVPQPTARLATMNRFLISQRTFDVHHFLNSFEKAPDDVRLLTDFHPYLLPTLYKHEHRELLSHACFMKARLENWDGDLILAFGYTNKAIQLGNNLTKKRYSIFRDGLGFEEAMYAGVVQSSLVE